MPALWTRNPCIDICKFNKKNICKACGRTKAEKKNWKDLSAGEKHAVWERILVSHGSSDKKKSRKLRARHDKIAGTTGDKNRQAQ
ncbi:MAG: DUF1289 domain-containing protein [Gammaproteobacteria bacterium]